jgi:hypothetical protein
MKYFLAIAVALAALSIASLAQNPITADSPFQTLYFTNIKTGGSAVTMADTGATGASSSMCVNFYASSSNTGDVVSCCSCLITPHSVNSVQLKTILLGVSPLPNSVELEAIATVGPTCNPGSSSGTLATGLTAWGTTAHNVANAKTYYYTETAFTPSTLSASEYDHLASQCNFLKGGMCGSCDDEGE